MRRARSLALVVRARPDEQIPLSVRGSLGPFASAPVPVAFFDSRLTCRLANDAFARLAGSSPDDLIGRSVTTCLPTLGDADVGSLMALLDGRGATVRTTLVIDPVGSATGVSSGAGTTYWTSDFFAATDDHGAVAGVAMVAVDTTDEVLRERTLAHRATHDALTGLPNRAELYERLAAAQARSSRRPTVLALLLLDLDDFKAVNDRFGHLAGDRVLVSVASRLQQVVRDGDTVARLGGDEFALLCEELTGPDAVHDMVVRAAAAASSPTHVGGRLLVVTASVGAAVGYDGETAEQLANRADTAMYEAKGRAARPPHLPGRAAQPVGGWADHADAADGADGTDVVAGASARSVGYSANLALSPAARGGRSAVP